MASADEIYDWDKSLTYEWELAGNIAKLNPYEVGIFY